MGRGLLRSILGQYLDIEPACLDFAYESRGKPVLTRGGPALHFNLSHSGDLSLLAVARAAPVGADLEQLRPLPDIDRISATFFSAHENVELQAMPQEQKLEGFFNGWTRKEAYLKATGQGITELGDQVEVSLTPGAPARILRIAGDAQAASHWSLHCFSPAPGFIGALAIQRSEVKPAFWQWPVNRAQSLSR
jgi:4'-phosphopantetheinyl transferase